MRPKRPVDLPEGFNSERVLRTIARIIDARDTIAYVTVARAMVLEAALTDPRHDERVADALGIIRQTAYNWLHNDLGEWLDRWEKRMIAVETRAPPPSQKRKRITEPEWCWIAKVLSSASARSWGTRAWAVRRAAGRDPNYGHLVRMSRVTLFKNRMKIREFQDALHVASGRSQPGKSDDTQSAGQNDLGRSPHEDALVASGASAQREEDPF